MSTDYHGEPIRADKRRVAPTPIRPGSVRPNTKRDVDAMKHEPVTTVLHLTDTERVTLRMALEKWIPFLEHRRAIRDALLLTLSRADATT